MRARALASLAALSLALAACGDDESTTATEPLTEATTAEPPTETTAEPPTESTTTTEQPQPTTTEQEVTPPSGGIGGGGSGGSDGEGGDSGGLSPQEKFEQFCDENPKACG